MFKVFTALALFGPNAIAADYSDLKPIEIAIAGGFSGSGDVSASPYGEQLRHGVELSLEWNRDALIQKGFRIKLREFDVTDTAGGVLSSAISIKNSNVQAVIGYPFSSEALMVAPIFQKAGLSFVSPGASVDRLKNFGAGVRAVAITNSQQGASLAKIAIDKGAKKALSISAMDCAYCQDLSNSFDRAFHLLGGTTVHQKIMSEDKDFSEVISRARKENFDTIFLPNYEILNGAIISAIAKNKIEPKFYLGGDGWGLSSAAFQAKPIKAYVIGYWHRDLKVSEAQRFQKMYLEKFKTEPTDMSVLAFDSMQLVIQGILRAPKLDRAGVEIGLTRVDSLIGALGLVSIHKQKSYRKNLVLEYTGADIKPKYLEGVAL